MSVWFIIEFFAVGDQVRIDELEGELPSLFHTVGEIDHVGTGLFAEVCQRNGGRENMVVIVERYRDLAFNGTMIYEADLQCGTYCTFTAINGKFRSRKLALPHPAQLITPEEIQNKIARINKRIAHLSDHRDMYLRQLRESEV
jgi:hypothetical protein